MRKKRNSVHKKKHNPFGPTLRVTQAELMDYLQLAPPATPATIKYRLVVDPVSVQVRTIHYPNTKKPTAI